MHHLLVAHELLGEVLIYTHNQHQLLSLFQKAREILKEQKLSQDDVTDQQDESAEEHSGGGEIAGKNQEIVATGAQEGESRGGESIENTALMPSLRFSLLSRNQRRSAALVRWIEHMRSQI